MHRVQWSLRLLVAGATLVTLMSSTLASAAELSDEPARITEDTAYTLENGEINLGLWKVDYGLFDMIDVGTYTWPWVLRFANVHAKWEIWHDDDLSFGASVGLMWLNLANLEGFKDMEDDPGVLYILPFEGAVSYRFVEDLAISAAAVFTKVAISGNLDEDTFEGAAAVTNLQLTSTVEWHLGDLVTLLLHVRYLAYQDASAATSVVLEPDEYTKVELHGAIQTDAVDVANAVSVTGSVLLSWDKFNLRMGLGYGNWSLPLVNFVMPMRTIVPDLSFYWRW